MIIIKINKSVLIILFMVTVFVLYGFINKKSINSSLNTPDKINMYAEGKQKQITKYDQALFNRVNTLVNIRIPQELATVKLAVSDNNIKEVKGYAVEFVYNKPQTLNMNNGNKQIQFTEIIFPLSEKWENMAFVKTKENFYTPVRLNENLDYLVKSSVK